MVLKGDLPIEIRWTYKDMPVLPEHGINIIKTSARISTMNIESVRGEHRGEFKCIARNLAGVAEFSSELNVNGIFFMLNLL